MIVVNYVKDNYIDGLKIKELYPKVLKTDELIIKIDSGALEYELKRDIRKIIKYRKLLLSIKQITLNVYNYSEENKLISDFTDLIINIIEAKNLDDLYNRVYILACNHLDSYFYNKNLCEFENNKCGAKRETDCTNGCCRKFEHKGGMMLPFNKLIPCEYLSETGRCTIKSIGCKLFTCDFLNKKGIKFRVKNVIALDTIFNPIQKLLLKLSIYKPQEITINKLLKVPNLKFFNKF